MGKVFELRGACLRFGRDSALEEIDLDVREGEVLVLLGPNGAEKTCALKLMCGLLAPRSGSVRALGDASLRRIGYCPQEGAVWDNLGVDEQLLLVASFYGIAKGAARSAELLGEFGLEGESGKLARELSRGNRRKPNLVLSLVHDPAILLLDEPEAELDMESRSTLVDYLDRLSRRDGRTIVVSTHHAAEAGRLAGRVAVLYGGRLLACAPPGDSAAPAAGGKPPSLERATRN